jgi:hypothetical protein
MKFTLSIKSFQAPATPSDSGFAAEFALGSDLAGHARDFGSEWIELRHHSVDQLDHTLEFALQRTPVDFQRHHLRKIAIGHRADDSGHFRSGLNQVVNQPVDWFDQTDPWPFSAGRNGALRDLAVTAYDSTDPLHLHGQPVVDIDHIVERVGDPSALSRPIARQSNRKIALLKRCESL